MFCMKGVTVLIFIWKFIPLIPAVIKKKKLFKWNLTMHSLKNSGRRYLSALIWNYTRIPVSPISKSVLKAFLPPPWGTPRKEAKTIRQRISQYLRSSFLSPSLQYLQGIGWISPLKSHRHKTNLSFTVQTFRSSSSAWAVLSPGKAPSECLFWQERLKQAQNSVSNKHSRYRS